MTTIKLHNSKTRVKEVFTPIDAENVRIYLCGPTVYDRAHIGNARNVIMFDVLFRLLRQVYGPDHVTYVRNFTDVDDKINAEALRRQKAGEAGTLEELIHQRTEETIAWYHADMDALGNLRPTEEPRATEYITQMIAMTEDLISKGHAYSAEGHVLFDVRSFPAYGQLSGRSVDDMIAGARVEVAPYKRDPMDFVLWKPSDDVTPGWDSPWGRGRPGWHIECSAMSQALLGPSFDIHGGGTDLTFPHHENELAQSCCANPDEGFANVWLHNEMLQVEGKKMSKSLGNFFTVRDLLDQGIPGEVIRFVFLQTHYRKTMDWTAEKAEQAQATLRKWREMVRDVQAGDEISESVVSAIADDLNTWGALAALHRIFTSIEKASDGEFRHLYDVLGIFPDENAPSPEVALRNVKSIALNSAQLVGLLEPGMGDWAKAVDLSAYADRLAAVWMDAKQSKNFTAVDAMKAALVAAGVEIQMGKDGVVLQPGAGFDAEKLGAIE
ncbi:cysteine--tRNA ligase [Pseudorhodobacter sp. W20_MBD10_FR17]|uniref:cysteine--tRNA ligase n=1 Tax=Pseudorhodobacter sp. W20_MBD10_FR17 TaxID=3240266 RepID=UPI003F9D4B7A